LVIPTPRGDRCVSVQNTNYGAPRFVSRNGILIMASQFLGTPYLWGGMTYGNGPSQALVDKQVKYGVDCSGLVHLCYRMAHHQIPRDSHDQWMDAEKIKRAQLLPADLIFSAKAANPKKVTHVALYAGNNQIIEAPQTGLFVRKISFKEKYGKELSQVESGDTVGERVIYFGRFFKDN
jgi:cell wall-associated NlpC family hydrolase